MRDLVGKLLALGGATGGGMAAYFTGELKTPIGALLGGLLVVSLRNDQRLKRIEEHLFGRKP